jgi:hypothetical protein
MSEVTKRCPKCERVFPATTEHFYANKKRRNGISGWCRECTCEYDRAYRASHKEKRHEQTHRYYTKHKKEINRRNSATRKLRWEYFLEKERDRRHNSPVAKAFTEWRMQGCLGCGPCDYRVVEAHHLNPEEKERNPGSFRSIKELELLVNELGKCVPLCANHHKLLHIELRNGHKDCTTEEVVEFLKESTHAHLRVVA